MDSFFIYVTGFAVLLLIVCLTGVGLLMRFQSAKDEFPPSANVCPDGWTVNDTISTACTIPSSITTLTGSTGYAGTSPNFYIDFKKEYYKDTCAKKKWANNNNIAWDGVSNYTQC